MTAAGAILNDPTAGLQVFTYDAYGNAVGFDAAQALTSLLYSGEFTNAGTGAQYLRARWYNPSTGTFNRLDPFAGNFTDPLSLNKYLYTHGNPVMGIDPTGLFTLGDVTAALSISGMVGGFAAGAAAPNLNVAYSTILGAGAGAAVALAYAQGGRQLTKTLVEGFASTAIAVSVNVLADLIDGDLRSRGEYIGIGFEAFSWAVIGAVTVGRIEGDGGLPSAIAKDFLGSLGQALSLLATNGLELGLVQQDSATSQAQKKRSEREIIRRVVETGVSVVTLPFATGTLTNAFDRYVGVRFLTAPVKKRLVLDLVPKIANRALGTEDFTLDYVSYLTDLLLGTTDRL
ncbi:MAG: RHS repeat-associated core domain-containing protein [Planctomycetota bacterium]